MNNFFERLLAVLVWLAEQVFGIGNEATRSYLTITTIQSGKIKIIGEISKMEIREGQEFDLTAAPKTRAGNPAAYEEGSVSWESSDSSILSVTQDAENELKATVKGLNGSANGTAVVTFRADGDPDAEETRELVGTLDVTVTQGEAIVFELDASPVRDTPAETPEA